MGVGMHIHMDMGIAMDVWMPMAGLVGRMARCLLLVIDISI